MTVNIFLERMLEPKDLASHQVLCAQDGLKIGDLPQPYRNEIKMAANRKGADLTDEAEALVQMFPNDSWTETWPFRFRCSVEIPEAA